MKLTSDLQAEGHEIRKARFEEGIALPANPFMGQFFHLKSGPVSKVFYFDGTQWICGVTSMNGRQGDITVTAVDVGLGNVNNTSDVNKPVSTAQQAAINAEATDRANADTTLQTNITNEATARVNGDSALSTRVTTLENGVTPSSTADRARANHTGTQLASTISDFATAADARITLQKAQPSGLASLDANGKLVSSQVSAYAITSSYVVNTQAAQLALVAEEGDLAIRSDLKQTFIKNAGTTGTMSDWNLLQTPTDLVLSVNGYIGAVVLGKADVGLSNVDNTSDINKPVSTAVAAAIAAAIANRRFAYTLPAMANNTSRVVTHNLGTIDIICGFQDATTKEAARLNWSATSINTVTVYTDIGFAANTIRMVIQA